MIRSIPLDVTPTAREAQGILMHLEEELRALGAEVQRTPYGAVHFRLPSPWRARHLGVLHVITSGRATIGAAAGAPWRMRYELKFTGLQWSAVALSALTVLAGLRVGGFVIFYAVLAVWMVFYIVPYAAATIAFRRLVKAMIGGLRRRGQAAGGDPGTA
ncbi:MAG TPA: hypothetical protein VMM17_00920 [Gemmatimonadaceae bacterium]|nr:hypothetical protein [Gemmatimonadaceae bacterium]